jgi:hypothetical protein
MKILFITTVAEVKENVFSNRRDAIDIGSGCD